MNKRTAILLENYINQRCILLQEDAVSYANMSNDELMAAYNMAQNNYSYAQQRALAFQQGIADNARTIYNSGVDVTRPLFGDDPNSKVWMPGTKSYLSKSEFKKLSNAIVNNGEYDGVKGASNLRKHFGMDKSWANKNTTDNTCAAFACAAIDMTSSTLGNTDALFTDSKNLSPDEWNNLINQNTYFDTDEYKHSVSKIFKAVNDKGTNDNNSNNWTTYDSKELLKSNPNYANMSDKDKAAYVRSPEFWKNNIRPGDMILYYDDKGKQKHVALAGHDNLQLYHDGSSVYTPQGRGEKEKSDHSNVRSGMHYKVVRYTNHYDTENKKKELDNLTAAVNSRPGFTDSYALGDDGTYSVSTPPTLTVDKPKVIEPTDDTELATIDPPKKTTAFTPSTDGTKIVQAKTGGFKPFSAIGNWLRKKFS